MLSVVLALLNDGSRDYADESRIRVLVLLQWVATVREKDMA